MRSLIPVAPTRLQNHWISIYFEVDGNMRVERRCFGFFPFILPWDVSLIMARREKRERFSPESSVCVFLPLYLVSFCHTKNALILLFTFDLGIKHQTWENESVCMFSPPVWVEYMCSLSNCFSGFWDLHLTEFCREKFYANESWESSGRG